MESGFSRKSKAPSLVALTAASMLPWPEIITTTGRSANGHLLDARQHLHAVHAGQPDIEQHQLEAAAGQRVQAGFAALHGRGGVAFVFEHAAQRLADARLVVHHQNLRRLHTLTAAPAAAALPPARPRPAAGISTVKRAPAGWLSSTRICALCSATMWLTMARPRPVPRFLVEK